MAFKIQTLCTVSRVFKHVETKRAWKQKDPVTQQETAHSITEDCGYHVSLKELGFAIPVGDQEPDVQVGDMIVATFEKR